MKMKIESIIKYILVNNDRNTKKTSFSSYHYTHLNIKYYNTYNFCHRIYIQRLSYITIEILYTKI